MTDETIRTLITAIAAVSTTGLTVWFAFRSQERKERLQKLERELKRALSEFHLLYKVEEKYLAELSTHLSKGERKIKIEFRKKICSEANEKITLSPSIIANKFKELDI